MFLFTLPVMRKTHHKTSRFTQPFLTINLEKITVQELGKHCSLCQTNVEGVTTSNFTAFTDYMIQDELFQVRDLFKQAIMTEMKKEMDNLKIRSKKSLECCYSIGSRNTFVENH